MPGWIVCALKRRHLIIEWEHGDYEPRSRFFPGTAVVRQPYCGRCGVWKLWERKKEWRDPLRIRDPR